MINATNDKFSSYFQSGLLFQLGGRGHRVGSKGGRLSGEGQGGRGEGRGGGPRWPASAEAVQTDRPLPMGKCARPPLGRYYQHRGTWTIGSVQKIAVEK